MILDVSYSPSTLTGAGYQRTIPPARATFRSVLANESHWLQACWYSPFVDGPTSVSVGGVLVGRPLVVGSHDSMIMTLGSCVKWPLSRLFACLFVWWAEREEDGRVQVDKFVPWLWERPRAAFYGPPICRQEYNTGPHTPNNLPTRSTMWDTKGDTYFICNAHFTEVAHQLLILARLHGI